MKSLIFCQLTTKKKKNVGLLIKINEDMYRQPQLRYIHTKNEINHANFVIEKEFTSLILTYRKLIGESQ